MNEHTSHTHNINNMGVKKKQTLLYSLYKAMPFDGHFQGALALICPVVSWGRAGYGDSERAGKSSSQCEGQHFVAPSLPRFPACLLQYL